MINAAALTTFRTNIAAATRTIGDRAAAFVHRRPAASLSAIEGSPAMAGVSQLHAAAVSAPAADAIAGRKILIYTLDTTGGHMALARSIKQEVLAAEPSASVEIVNGYDGRKGLETQTVRNGFRKVQLGMLEHAPALREKGIEMWHDSPTLINLSRGVTTAMFRPQVERKIAEVAPDLVISTQGYIGAALGAMRRDGTLKVPVAAALADMDPHGMWVSPGIDLHVANNPGDLARVPKVFAARHGEQLKMAVARPTVDPRVLEPHDVAASRAKFGLPPDKKVGLIFAGTLGSPYRDDEIRAILDGTDMHLAVGVGRNETYGNHLRSVFPSDRVTVIGMTDDFPSLLKASDAAVLRANGVTSFEAMATGTPVVFYRPTAGASIPVKAATADGYASFPRSKADLVDAMRAVERGDSGPATRAAKARTLFDNPKTYGQTMLDLIGPPKTSTA